MPTVLVVGAGIAGLSAAWQAARSGHRLVVVDPLGPGGQLMSAGVVDSAPGWFPEPTGPDLVSRLVDQFQEYDVRWLHERVVNVRPRYAGYQVVTDNGDLAADAVIVASGATARPLGVPGASELQHLAGVSYCATCDGPLFREKAVAVVGGGDTAAEAALYLAGMCSRVHLIHRHRGLRAIEVLQRRLENLPNIERHPDTDVTRVLGRETVQGLEIENRIGGPSAIEVAGVFIAIGSEPNPSPVASLVDIDPAGCIVVDATLASTAPGVFAAGAVRAGSSGQLAGAIGDGVTAAVSADRWLRAGPGARRQPRTPPRREFIDYPDFFDSMDAAGIGDGLPLVPPTQERFERFAAASPCDPEGVLTTLADGTGVRQADLMISAIRAGCRPQYLPVVSAAATSLLVDIEIRRPRLAEATSVVVVNGPVRNALDVNCSDGLFGPGWRANATIGRAIRLFVRDYLEPGQPAGFGDAGQFAFCFGEDEEKSPWVPLHVQRGLAAGDSAATVFTVDVHRQVMDRQHTDPDEILRYVGLFLRGRASGTRLFGSRRLWPMLVIGQELRRHLAPRYSKAALCERLHSLVVAGAGDAFGPIDIASPDDISILGAGGVATPTLWCFISRTPTPMTSPVPTSVYKGANA